MTKKRTVKILKNMVFPSKPPLVFSLIMTVSKCLITEHSIEEDRYHTIGDTSAGGVTVIGNLKEGAQPCDILFVVYTERELTTKNGKTVEVTRLISARLATNFERGLYYGKHG